MLTLRDKIMLFPLWFISLFPLPVLFVISDFVFLIVYYVTGYRKKVVIGNLKKAFPELTDEGIKKMAKTFFRHLCDYFFETLYMLNMGNEEVKRRYKPQNPEVIEELYARGINAIAVTSHYANWEWAASGWIQMPYKTIGIYKPLSNKLFDRFMIHLRSRYGSPVEPMKHTLRAIIESQKQGDTFILYLVGDQRPMKSEIQYWTTFMNQETPLITGPEKLAKKFNLAVVFIDVIQKRRGYYELNYNLITDKPKETEEFEITEKYIRLVEKQIMRNPGLYLWSHKRWKHKKELADR
ncbi:MAG: lysophospholipid acyltransferase family protein [Bacteroidales bacterium]|nr:lysophospholipid acyltransferase family protein [Bacteroidales bacterium]